MYDSLFSPFKNSWKKKRYSGLCSEMNRDLFFLLSTSHFPPLGIDDNIQAPCASSIVLYVLYFISEKSHVLFLSSEEKFVLFFVKKADFGKNMRFFFWAFGRFA